ncbi:MAG: ATP-binding protein [Synergistaceae bacterium]|nr:AAA family ATPase [Synergistota bacterium]NLM71398.1 ATP-binding protein [Synergistaceae bacterium]
MINEIYIDNYNCLVNFRVRPKSFQLWLGDNGSGKSSVLHAIRSIQRLMRGAHVDDVFDPRALTAWDKRREQTVGLVLTIEGERYDYSIVVEHSPAEGKRRIAREELLWNGSRFFLFDGHEAHLFRQNRTTEKVEQGASFPADWSRSVIPTVAKRDDNVPLVRFREELEKILLIHPVPMAMQETALSESRLLSEHGENFARWYRHVLQEWPAIGYEAKRQLEDVLPGFGQLSLKESGEFRRLMATFRITDNDYAFDFAELSDGQRQLVLLYTVLEALRLGVFSSVFIDEPDNFISMREIQPWLDNLNSMCDEFDRQAIIISHHPEVVNRMARGEELWFSRKEGSHVEAVPFPVVEGITPAEVMARGWENE